MRNISQEAFNLYEGVTRDIKGNIYLNGNALNISDVIDFSIEEGINSEDDFTLGGACSSSLTLNLWNENNKYTDDNTITNGMILEPDIGIKLSNGDVEYTRIGKYIIDSITKAGTELQIIAYDFMAMKTNEDYICDLTFPVLYIDLLKDVCSLCEIEINESLYDIPFLQETLKVNPFVEGEPITAREVIRDIAICSGGWAIINKRGELEFCFLNKREYVLTPSEYISMDIEDGIKIDCVEVTNVMFPNVEPISLDLTISPFEGEYFGNLGISCGDYITIIDRNNKSYNAVITQQKIIYNGGLTIEISSEGMNETQINSKTENYTNKEGRKYESKFQVLSDGIKSSVKYDDMETIIEQDAEKWGLSIDGKLKGAKYEFDGNSAKFFNAGLDIYKGNNIGSEKVFEVNRDGDTVMNGSWCQFNYEDGIKKRKSLAMNNGQIAFFDYKMLLGEQDNMVGYISPMYINAWNKVGVCFNCDNGDLLSLGYRDSSGNNVSAIRIDGCDTPDETTNFGVRTIFNKPAGMAKGCGLKFFGNTVDSPIEENGYIYCANNDNFIIRSTSGHDVALLVGSNTKLSANSSGVNITGNLYATGTVTQGSDVIYKTNITPIEGSVLDDIMNTQIYEYTKDGQLERGVIAQECINTLPVIINGEPTNFTIEDCNSMTEEELKSIRNLFGEQIDDITTPLQGAGVNLYSMISTLWKGVQEQQLLIKEKDTKIKELEDKITKQQEQIDEILKMLKGSNE